MVSMGRAPRSRAQLATQGMSELPNKEMQLTRPVQIPASQLISSVRQAWAGDR